MPHDAPQPCRYPGCRELVRDKSARGLCVGHVRETRALRRRTTERRRRMSDEDLKRDSWYSSRDWRHLRRAYISRNPLCEFCARRGITKAADVVDHIIERKDDDSLRLDSGNLQSLCHKCHNIKTLEERDRRRGFSAELEKKVQAKKPSVDDFPV